MFVLPFRAGWCFVTTCTNLALSTVLMGCVLSSVKNTLFLFLVQVHVTRHNSVTLMTTYEGVQITKVLILHTLLRPVTITKKTRGIAQSVWRLDTGWAFRGSNRNKFCVFQNVHIGPGAYPTSYSMGTGSVSQRVKRLGSETDCSSLSSTEVKTGWSYTSTPCLCLHDMLREDLCLYLFYAGEHSVMSRSLWELHMSQSYYFTEVNLSY